MAHCQTPFKFQNVQIEKKKHLGIGNKIVVYKAECDGITCAAKMLDTREMPENVQNVPSGIKTQFDILSRCQHPNIVQYLGETTDSENGQPVFLIELMDQNLAQFLGQHEGPLPYYMQVDICNNIAQALNYLHSNDIIHCNLSSRNILLSGGKAKVDVSTSYILRKDPDCPGKPSYMPPEGFTMQYTCKLDCFSFGVLAVEIITKETPEPGPPNQSEIDRRRNHIHQIDQDHPLLRIVLECLKDKDTERPSSQDLCRRLAVLKKSPDYIKSFQKHSPTVSLQNMSRQLDLTNQEKEEKRQQLAQANQELKGNRQLLAQANQDLQEKSQQLAQANQDLQEKSQQLVQANQELREKSQQLAPANQELQAKSQGVQPQLTSTDVTAWTVPRTEVEIQDQIGGGAWGTVVKGRFRNQQVAVKSPHPAIINPQTLERLRREVRIMAQVRHPNLLRFIAAVFDDETPPLIITELLDMNLRTAYENGRLQNPNKLLIFQDVAYALHYLHEHEEPIIHRDVSAPNVLLEALPGGTWRAKVSDFGSANLARLSQTLGEGAIIYSAPETFPHVDPDVRPPQQTTKIDVYSYGILLCEVVTCQLPDPVKYQDMLKQVQTQWLFLYDLIISCTKHNPDIRPTMLQVLDKLNN